MTTFQAKIVWKRQRKRENKNYSFVPSLPDVKFKIPKKFKQRQYGFFIYSQNRLENAEKEGKYILSFCFFPTQRVIENSKKKAKKLDRKSVV